MKFEANKAFMENLSLQQSTLTRTKTSFPWISFIHLLYRFYPGNMNLPLTRSNFCFPSDRFYTILPSITQTMFYWLSTWQMGKKRSDQLQSKTLNFSQNNHVFFVCKLLFFFVSPFKVIPWFCTAHLLLRITRWPP